MRDADLVCGMSDKEICTYQEIHDRLLHRVLASPYLVATALKNAGSAKAGGFSPAFMVCDEADQCHEGDFGMKCLVPTNT